MPVEDRYASCTDPRTLLSVSKWSKPALLFSNLVFEILQTLIGKKNNENTIQF